MPITTVHVQYRCQDGYHIFTSEKIDGLYIASRNAEEAYKNVAKAIRELLKLNENVDVEVQAAMPFGDFLRAVRDSTVEAPHPAHLGGSFFVIQRAA